MTIDHLIAAAAYDFMTAGGMNSADELDDIIGDGSHVAAHVEEAFEGWDMGDISRDDFAAAIADFIANRPDRDA